MNDSSTPAPVSISLIDGFSLFAGEERLQLAAMKAQAMLAHVALSPGMEQSRERLAGLLWGDSPERRARASLRGALLAVREALGDHADRVLHSDNRIIRLNPGTVIVDVMEIGNALRSGHVPAPLLEQQNVCESILANVSIEDDTFVEWLAVFRQTTQENWMRPLREILRSTEPAPARGQAAAAIRNMDPLHEEACRYLMETAAAEGDTAGALRIYNQLYEGLGEEYDMEPSEETMLLVERIKRGEIAPAPQATAATSAPHSPAPAVLPSAVAAPPHGDNRPEAKPIVTIYIGDFAARSVSDAQQYLVSGFKGDLIAGLVRFRDWVIVGGAPNAAGRISNPNDPHYHLTASAMEEPGGIRLSLFIQHAVTDQFVWTERFLLSLEEWAMRQRMVVRRLAMALNVHLSSERVRSLAAADEFSAGVQDQWLRGMELQFRWRPEALNQASGIFHRIIEEAPTFAPAYSSLVQIANSRHLIFPGVYRTASASDEALTLAKQAVSIDPLSSRAHLALAWSHMFRSEFDQAEFRYDLARDLNENDTWTLVSSGQGLAFAGRREQAHGLSDEALLLNNQLSPVEWGYQVGTRFLCGDYAMAVESAERAGDVIPNLPAWKAASLVYLDRPGEARAEGRRFLEKMREQWAGGGGPTDAEIVAWLLASFPIRNAEDRERFTQGVLQATDLTEAALLRAH